MANKPQITSKITKQKTYCRACDRDISVGSPVLRIESHRNYGQVTFLCTKCVKVIYGLSEDFGIQSKTTKPKKKQEPESYMPCPKCTSNFFTCGCEKDWDDMAGYRG